MSDLVLTNVITINDFEAFQRKFFNELDSFKEYIISQQEWLTAQESMEYLRIGETKFYSLKKKGIIEHHNLDGTKLYNKEELREAVKNDPQ